jgi:hypothetical protein
MSIYHSCVIFYFFFLSTSIVLSRPEPFLSLHSFKLRIFDPPSDISPGNPCLSACTSFSEASSSAECAHCCRTVQHEVPWNCPNENEVEKDGNHNQVAACCFGNWSSHCWDKYSVDNHFHSCSACCGVCSDSLGACGECHSEDPDSCYCGGCVNKSGDLCWKMDENCTCPYSFRVEEFLLMTYAIFLFIVFVCMCSIVIMSFIWLFNWAFTNDSPQVELRNEVHNEMQQTEIPLVEQN